MKFDGQNDCMLKMNRRGAWARTRLGGQDGFSLVELILVIVIIGILATIAVANYVNLANSAKSATCIANQMAVETAQTLYYSKHYIDGHAEYAATLEDLLPFLSRVTPPACPDKDGKIEVLPDGTATCILDSHKRQSTP
jgi:prepilin-type N-terminal cleavage/methylation domain-containing protein